MNAITLNSSELTRQLGEEIPDIYVTIAKHQALDMDSQMISELLGLRVEELDELQKEPLYQNVLLLIRAASAERNVDIPDLWDAIEHASLKRLAEKAPLERDTEVLLKMAAIANRAQRRSPTSNTLELSDKALRVPLTLTSRITKKLNRDGSMEQVEERSVRVLDGSHGRASFDEVDQMLQVSPRPFMDRKMTLETTTVADPSADDIMDSFLQDERDNCF